MLLVSLMCMGPVSLSPQRIITTVNVNAVDFARDLDLAFVLTVGLLCARLKPLGFDDGPAWGQ